GTSSLHLVRHGEGSTTRAGCDLCGFPDDHARRNERSVCCPELNRVPDRSSSRAGRRCSLVDGLLARIDRPHALRAAGAPPCACRLGRGVRSESRKRTGGVLGVAVLGTVLTAGSTVSLRPAFVLTACAYGLAVAPAAVGHHLI